MAHIVAAAEAEERQQAAALTQLSGKASYDELVSLVQEMRTEKEESDRLEAEAKQHKDRYDEIRKNRIPELMQQLGLVKNNKGKFNTPDGAIHLETKLYASIPEQVKDQVFTWFRRHGHEDIIKETVNAQTLSAFIRELREDNKPEPPGVAIHTETVAKLTKK